MDILQIHSNYIVDPEQLRQVVSEQSTPFVALSVVHHKRKAWGNQVPVQGETFFKPAQDSETMAQDDKNTNNPGSPSTFLKGK